MMQYAVQRHISSAKDHQPNSSPLLDALVILAAKRSHLINLGVSPR